MGDLFDAAPGDDAVRLGFGDGLGVVRALEVVVLLDEKPVWLALVCGLAAHADERPLALQLGAVKNKLERTGAKPFVYIGVTGLRAPGALIPQHDGASAVLPLRDDALEAA